MNPMQVIRDRKRWGGNQRSRWVSVQRMAACLPRADDLCTEVHWPSAIESSTKHVTNYPRAIAECIAKIRSNYAHLYQLPVVEYLDGSRAFHNGILLRCQGINLLYLKGDTVEMAFQHGRLLADQIAQGAVPQAAKLITNLVANAVGNRSHWGSLLYRGVHRFLTTSILRSSLEKSKSFGGRIDALDEAVALSDASGISVTTLVDAMLAPDTMMILAGKGKRKCPEPATRSLFIAPLLAGCSSFAAWGSSTLDGGLLVGRNMDYPLNGYYDRFPTVIYYHPTVGGFPYMSFTSAGVHNCGLTAYNSAGLFLASHVVPSIDTSAHGVAAPVIANYVIRHAQSFDAAVDLFQHFRAPSGWAYLIVSSKERRVGTVEISNRHVAVRESDNDYFVQTNRFQTHALSPSYLSLNRSVDEDSDTRCTRIKQILEQEQGRMDVAGIMSILADQVDPSVNEVRGLGNTVGVHTTVTSVVLRPDDGRAYVAAGTAPAGHAQFLEVPLFGALNQPESFPAQLQIIDNSEFTRTHPRIWSALQLFIRAKSAYENDNDVPAAYELLQQTVRCDPSNPAYFFQLGIFALKNRQFGEACEAFDSVFSRPYVTQQLSRLARYYRGRAHAHLSLATAAISDLSTVVADKDADGPLRTAAQRALRRTKLFGRCPLKQRSLMIMMQQSDMLHY